MLRDSIIDLVKKKLDEMTPPGESISHPVDSIIGPMLDESFREALITFPVHLLPLGELDLTPNTKITFADGNGIIILPTEFARLASLKFPLWINACQKEITQDHPAFALQCNEYTAGGKARPVCVKYREYVSSAYVWKLKCYDITTGTTAVVATEKVYVKNSIADMPDKGVDALSWLTALKVAEVLQIKTSGIAATILQNILKENTY